MTEIQQIGDSELVVIGGSIGCLVSALSAGEAGARVTLILPHNRVGGGFATLEQDGFLLDVGCRRFDLTADQVGTTLDQYQPGTRTRPFATHYRSFLEDTIGLELVATPPPQMSYDGKFAADFVTSLDLTSLRNLMSKSDLEKITAETDAILSAQPPSPLTLGLGSWPDLSAVSLQEASLANHGATFHTRLVETMAKKLYPAGWSTMPADLATKIWTALFFPRTINSGCRNELERDRPGITYFYPVSGHFGEFVSKLLARIYETPTVQIIESLGLTSLTRDGKEMVAQQSDGATYRWSCPFALGTSVDNYSQMAGKTETTDKLPLALLWADIAEDDLLIEPEMINVFDADTSAYRISLGGTGGVPGRCVVTLEMTGQSEECSKDGAISVLTRMGILRPGANINVIKKDPGLKIVAPSNRNRRLIADASASFADQDINPILIGTLNDLRADTLADNVLQGLKIGSILRSGGTL